MTENQKCAIRFAMIDAASLVRVMNGNTFQQSFALEIIEELAPLVDGWLPEAVEIVDGKVIVNPR